ncbi:unnamed protein product [Mycena citricolor]|uniref:Uncharacterized protein n=1 Tax=Mycena citricolor TaxID=2018698 RepID=A0AAD2Q433_9AGAR|nr:unnamed protein product [Mycena citricolor]
MPVSRHTKRIKKDTSSNVEDDAWEDVDEEQEMQSLDARQEMELFDEDDIFLTSQTQGIPINYSRTPTPRKRRHKKEFVASPGPPRKTCTPPVQSPSLTPTPSLTPLVTKKDVLDGGAFVGWYFLDVFRRAIMLLRIPLSALLFLWMLAFLIGLMSHSIRAAFRPLCFIPGLGSSSLCRPHGAAPTQSAPRWADFPSLVDMQSATVDQLLDETSSGSALALQIKKAEMATTDLVTLVGVSELRSRDILSDALRTFVDDARTTGRSLNKLSSKVSGAVDGIMAVNDYALLTIEGAHQKPAPPIWGSLIPWKSSTSKTAIILDAFEDSMNYLSFTLQRLVVEFELSMRNLDNLEEKLSVLHEMVTREDVSLSSAKSELLSELWTILGGNRRKLRGYENHLGLLKGLGQYRKQALMHVVSALQALTQMSEDIENLRERLAAPELTGSRIPVEVHIKSIQSGLERIKEGRAKAKEKETDAVRRILGSDAA